jgi:uncharacterized protein DUF6081
LKTRHSCTALCLALTVAAATASPGAAATPAGTDAEPRRTRLLYDDFKGGPASYGRKWLQYLSLEQQFGATNLPAFSRGRLRLLAQPFRGWMDDTCLPGFPACVSADHIKYGALSRRTFSIPRRGSVAVSADVRALTSGIRPGYVVAATGRVLPEAHQAAAILQLIEPSAFVALDWFVSGRQAIPKIERTPAPVGVDLGRAFTQFLPAVQIEPRRFHRYSIRYTRGRAPRDKVEWLLDGRVVTVVRDVGVPLDVQDPQRYAGITFPSHGPGERVASAMSSFVVGHGLYSFVDDFPFFPAYPEYFVSIPQEQRIFGQGIDASFDDVRIAKVTR